MKEELTTKMHSEFTVSPETDLKHKCWAAWEYVSDGNTIKEACESYQVTTEQMMENKLPSE